MKRNVIQILLLLSIITLLCTTQGKASDIGLPPIPALLKVEIQGSGKVNDYNDPGTVCSNSCFWSHKANDEVVLVATPASGYVFSHWEGDGCSGSSSTCTVKLKNIVTVVKAVFLPKIPQTYALELQVNPAKTGTIIGNGIDCSDTCSRDFNAGTLVTLTAVPAEGYTFDHWSGCSNNNSSQCTVKLDGDKTVIAFFKKASNPPAEKYSLKISKIGTGKITSTPYGINCGDVCSADFPKGTSVSLTAIPEAGYKFSYWEGCDTVNNNQCVVTVKNDINIVAHFEKISNHGNIQFSKASYSVKENIGSLTVAVIRTQGTDGTVSIHYYTQNGTATSGSDYRSAQGNLVWKDGEGGSKTFTINIIDDNTKEDSETLSIVLSNPSGGAKLGNPSSAVITILDNDQGDTIPPETSIVSGPSGTINYHTVSFVWTGSDNSTPKSRLTYSYKLERYDSKWSDFTATTLKTYTNLPCGSYVFKVRAKDEAGNVDPTPAIKSFVIEKQHPTSYKISSTIICHSDGQKPLIEKHKNNIYVVNYYSKDGHIYLKLYISKDDGRTFDLGPDITWPISADAGYDMCSDEEGNLFIFWANYSDDALYYIKISGEGKELTSPVDIVKGKGFTWISKPHCFVDKKGHIYVIFKGRKNKNMDLYFVKSTDSGKTFSAPYQITNDSVQEDDAKIFVFGSTIYVVYLDYYKSHNLYLIKSTDNGLTFSNPVRVNAVDKKVDFGSDVAIDNAGTIFIAYKDTANDDGDIKVAKSTDGGKSFSYTNPLDSTYLYQEYPLIFVENNNIYLAWYDHRNRKGYDVYFSDSFDGGFSWRKNINVSNNPPDTIPRDLIVENGTIFITAVDRSKFPECTTILYKLTPYSEGSMAVDLFSVNPKNIKTGDSATFICIAHDSYGNIVSYKWDFDGDGTPDQVTSSNTISHKYENRGIYHPIVTIIDDAGESVKSSAITVIVGISKGDLNADGKVDLTDAIIALRVAAGLSVKQNIYSEVEPTGDGRIGLDDAVFILKRLDSL